MEYFRLSCHLTAKRGGDRQAEGKHGGLPARSTWEMKRGLKDLFKSFSLELPVYAGLVVIYFFLVLHFLGRRLYDIFRHERTMYAVLALLLIVAQGIVLESLTRALLAKFGRKRED